MTRRRVVAVAVAVAARSDIITTNKAEHNQLMAVIITAAAEYSRAAAATARERQLLLQQNEVIVLLCSFLANLLSLFPLSSHSEAASGRTSQLNATTKTRGTYLQARSEITQPVFFIPLSQRRIRSLRQRYDQHGALARFLFSFEQEIWF